MVIPKPKPQADDKFDPRRLIPVLMRTATLDLTVLAPQGLRTATVAELLAWDPADIQKKGVLLLNQAKRLPHRVLTPTQRQQLGKCPLPAQCGWVRATAFALAPFPRVEEAVSITAAGLHEQVDRDAMLRVIHTQAGRAVDGAMDARAYLAGFQWFVVTDVLTALRQRVLAEPDRQKQEELVRPFAPMLVIIEKLLSEQGERREDLAGERKDLKSALSTAEADKARAEALFDLHRGAEVSKEELLDLARHHEKAPPARPTGRGTRGRPRPMTLRRSRR
jgi:hypothetical protein